MHLVDRDRRVRRLARAARRAIQASSRQAERRRRPTIEAVAGGSSVCQRHGSAFSGSTSPSAPSDLVFVARARRQRAG